MGINIGNSTINNLYVGNTQVSKVYLGDTQVRPNQNITTLNLVNSSDSILSADGWILHPGAYASALPIFTSEGLTFNPDDTGRGLWHTYCKSGFDFSGANKITLTMNGNSRDSWYVTAYIGIAAGENGAGTSWKVTDSFDLRIYHSKCQWGTTNSSGSYTTKQDAGWNSFSQPHTIEFDLVQQKVTIDYSGTRMQGNLTSGNVTSIRNCTKVYFGLSREYSSQNYIAMSSISINVE